MKGSGFPRNPTYLRLPGTVGNYASTPDSAALSITGDIDIRVKVALDNWGVSAQNQDLVAKWISGGGAGSFSYIFYVLTTGALGLAWSADGLTTNNPVSTVSTGFAAGSSNWIRATLAVSTGQATFYKSADGLTWTQLGGLPAAVGVTSIFNSTLPVTLGWNQATRYLTGNIFYTEVRNGINGPIAIAFNLPDFQAFSSTFPKAFYARQSALWTINGSAWNWHVPISRRLGVT